MVVKKDSYWRWRNETTFIIHCYCFDVEVVGAWRRVRNKMRKEQKYYVDLDTAAYVAKWNGNDQVDIYTDGISGSDEFEFHLTEQEIKDYDERFWPFAVKVEELEE